MTPVIRPRVPRRPPRRQASDPFYGYGYDPARPSVLAVAHDEAAGERVFVILDRPCKLVGSGTLFPIVLPDGAPPGPALPVVAADLVLPVKLRLTFPLAIAQGARWRWAGDGACDLVDAGGAGVAPNPGAGECADLPGPPPGAASVVSASTGAFTSFLTFDRPVGVGPYVADGSILVDGLPPTDGAKIDAATIQLSLAAPAGPGSTWAIDGQPGWVFTPLGVPVSGVFG